MSGSSIFQEFVGWKFCENF